MEGKEFEDFKQRIQLGLREPIWLYEDQVLDGRNRERACAETGVEPKYRSFSGTHAEALRFVMDMNYYRRQLTDDQKRRAIEVALEHDPNLSDREIAKKTKSSPPTVAKVRNAKGLHKTERTEASGRKARGAKPGSGRKRKSQPNRAAGQTSSPGQVVISGEQRRAEAARAELEQQLDNVCSNENLGAEESAEVIDSAGAASGAKPTEAPAANGHPLDVPDFLLRCQPSTANEVPAESEVPAASNDPAETEAPSAADLVEFAQAIKAKAVELGRHEIAALDLAIIIGLIEVAAQVIDQMETSEAG
jgi:hypothetical protein